MNKKFVVIWSVAMITLGFGCAVFGAVHAEPIDCQYPTRPLVNGRCDNTDPACPETIKEDGGNCFKSTPPQPPVTVVEPTPTPVEAPKVTECGK